MGDLRFVFARRWSRGQLIALDGLAAWAFTLAFLGAAAAGDAPQWARLAVPLGLGLPLVLRRVRPTAVFGSVLAVSVLAAVLDVVGFAYAAPAYALYAVALEGRRGRWVPTGAVGIIAAIAVVGLAVLGAPGSWARHVGGTALGVVVLAGAWTVGQAVRERRIAAARDAELLAGRAVAEERLRIARELHDVVAHSLGLIAVKAGVANHVVRTRPQEAHDALAVIETASRSALVEMRHLLGALRTEAPDLTPVPGLSELGELAARARLAGVEVDLHVCGGDALPDGVALSAYRIVQEALTNVVKHAAPARCRVDVTADGRQLRIEAVDDGPGRRMLPGPAGGHGLLGMRERVATYGGVFSAGPREDTSGFRVAATLPYGDTA
ncbi:sensor histidine kinase [Pseudonocardia nigra]|uniref:sensor histidine kinase n=1 Tax=Pseudonocardia nigra TaxID=1921578 RepID=UPI0027E3635A|nr:histidine kinase [Pseudonocardia nigra]